MMKKRGVQLAAMALIIAFACSAFSQEQPLDKPAQADEFVWPSIPTLIMFIAVPTLTTYYGMEAWDWGEQKNPRWGNEGWFGQNTDTGGADKIGHAYSHYLAFRVFYNYYDWSERGRDAKWFYSITSAVFLGVFIEFGDSFTGKYGFSYEDVVSDLAGIGLGILLEYSPTLDSLIGFSWQFWPTDGYFERFGYNPLHLTSDYSGATFVFNFKLAGLPNIGIDIPDFFRYLQLDVGYFTRNYVRWDITDEPPYRSIYYGISINFAEVVKDFFDDPNSRTSRVLQQPFKYYHIPAGYSGDYKL